MWGPAETKLNTHTQLNVLHNCATGTTHVCCAELQPLHLYSKQVFPSGFSKASLSTADSLTDSLRGLRYREVFPFSNQIIGMVTVNHQMWYLPHGAVCTSVRLYCLLWPPVTVPTQASERLQGHPYCCITFSFTFFFFSSQTWSSSLLAWYSG